MKQKIIALLLFVISCQLICNNLKAQTPDKMSYQAVIRNLENELVTNSTVGIKISIIKSTINGQIVYAEEHSTITNSYGLINLEVGTGYPLTGNFSGINWWDDNYFIRTDTDPYGGSYYVLHGVSQLLSVPYAMHARTAESISGNIVETDPLFSGSPAALLTEIDLIKLSNLTGVNTGDQDLSGLVTITSLTDSLSILRSEIPIINGYLIEEVDPLFSGSPAAMISELDIINLSNLSGINTGDQDLSHLVTINSLSDSLSILRSEIPIINNYLIEELDPLFLGSPAALISDEDIINLSNLSGENTGDQDLSHLVTKNEFEDSLNIIRSEIPDVGSFIIDEIDPYFSSSPASAITEADILNWNNKQDAIVAGNGIIISGNVISTEFQQENYSSNSEPEFTHYIGELYGGGVIFHLWKDENGNEKGLIVSLNHISTSSGFSNVTTDFIGSSSRSLWDGNTNTNAIINQQGHTASAAQLAREYTGGGYTDWYLPALDELNLLYNNRYNVNRTLASTPGATQIGHNRYWASVEHSENCAWAFYFYNGFTYYDFKTKLYFVCAIRSF